MNYFTMNDDGDEFIATTSLKERTWWRNLRGGVPVSVRLQGRDYKGISRVIENGGELEHSLEELFKQNPQNARYFQVEIDLEGLPTSESLKELAKLSVFVRTDIQSDG